MALVRLGCFVGQVWEAVKEDVGCVTAFMSKGRRKELQAEFDTFKIFWTKCKIFRCESLTFSSLTNE